jgi:hypothetical protein
MLESIKQGSFPLWTPYYYSGRPLFAQPEYYFIDFNFILLLLTGNLNLAMNFSVIIHLFLSGLGMFLLVNYFLENKKAAFISAIIYMFNGFFHTFVLRGNIMVIEGYSLIPFILFFVITALKGRQFATNAIIAGLLVAALISVGGVIFLPYTVIIIGAYSLVHIIGNNMPNKVLKIAIVGAVILLVGFGVSAIKLLPGLEFMSLSNRSGGVPYQEYLGEPVNLNNFVFVFITNVFANAPVISASIGIMGFILLIFGLRKMNSKIVLFSGLLVGISILISTESFLTKFLYTIPVFNQTRHIERGIFLFVLGSSILAGYGFLNLQKFIEKYKKVNKKLIFGGIISLILLELLLMQVIPSSIDAVSPDNIPILKLMSEDPSKFRTINLGLETLIGATGYNYYAQKGISELKGGSGIWFNDYLGFLSVAQASPAKFWGVLNNKYVVSSKKIDIEGLELVKTFDSCKQCPIWESYGPYLYENTEFVPRYYIVPNSIFIVGDYQLSSQLELNIMAAGFNQKNTIILKGTKISDYDIKFLNKFDTILLVRNAVNQNNLAKLQQYVDQGGILIPDIINGQTTVTNEQIAIALNRTKDNYKEVKIGDYMNNKVIINLDGQEGWLVASERFAYFPGWIADLNGKDTQIFSANSAVSAVYLDGEIGKLTFEYKPDSYKKGKLITLIAIILIVSYFSYNKFRKKMKKGDDNQA